MSTIEKALAKRKQREEKESSESLQSTIEKAQQAEASIDSEVKSSASAVGPAAQPASFEEDAEAKAEAKVETSAEQYSTNLIDREVCPLDPDFLISKGFIVGGHEESHTKKEEFRNIKRKLLNNAFGPASATLNNGNLVMVTSSVPNEGKTFISINLALSIALEQDKTVLLIDADVLRPSVNRELNLTESVGLVEYLLGEVDNVADIIRNTSIPNLKIISAGKRHYLTNELLASDKMADLTRELADRYPDRMVVFDSPPLLGVTETPILANLLGQALIVVEESRSRLDNIKRAASLLNEDMAVGIVMNKTIQTYKDGYGYYGYGYRADRKA